MIGFEKEIEKLEEVSHSLEDVTYNDLLWDKRIQPIMDSIQTLIDELKEDN